MLSDIASGQGNGNAYVLTVTVGDWWCPKCDSIGRVENLRLNRARSQCKKCGYVAFLRPDCSSDLETAKWVERVE